MVHFECIHKPNLDRVFSVPKYEENCQDDHLKAASIMDIDIGDMSISLGTILAKVQDHLGLLGSFGFVRIICRVEVNWKIVKIHDNYSLKNKI